MPLSLSPTRPALRWEWRGKQYVYAVTDDDRAWFIRALWREGKPALAVGHTLLQRFALNYSTGKNYASLTAFVRAYSQPLNPAWLPGAKLSEAFISRAEKANNTASADDERRRAANRVIYCSTPVTQVPKEYRDLADRILTGKTVSPVPTATHFTMSFAAVGDGEEVAKKKGEAFAGKRGLTLVPLTEGFKRGLNWFFRTSVIPPVIRFGTSTGSSALGAIIMLIPWSLVFLWLKRR